MEPDYIDINNNKHNNYDEVKEVVEKKFTPNNLSRDIYYRRQECILDLDINKSSIIRKSSKPEEYNKIYQYKNVYIYSIKTPMYYFHPIIAVEEASKKIISKSNTFINDIVTINNPNYEKQYKIYMRLNYTYYNLLQNIKSNYSTSQKIKDECILFANPFNNQNSGHDMSITNYFINYYLMLKESGIKSFEQSMPNIILLDESKKCPRILEYIELFIPKEQFVFISLDKIYLFENIHIPLNYQFRIEQFPYLTTKAIETVNTLQSIDNKLQLPKYSKVFLVKSSNHICVSKYNMFSYNEIIPLLESLGYIIINPETEHFHNIIYYLSNASKIIVSYGSILYTHQNFFNNDAIIYFITACGEAPYAINKNYRIINLKSNDLNNISTEFLQSIGE